MRKIIHLDMDCFFAAVEMRDKPELKNIPIAIASPTVKRGVLSTCNYEARKYGLRSAMPTALALKLCPHVKLVRPQFKKYRTASQEVFSLILPYAERSQVLSMDEAYLDVTTSKLFQGSATLLAEHLRKLVFEKTGLTCSTGIAPNKLVAKIATDFNKPNGQFTVEPHKILSFMSTLPLIKIHGIGPKSAQKLSQEGFKLCQDLYQLSKFEMAQRWGKTGEWLYCAVRGIDDRPVLENDHRKSMSVENTFMDDLKDWKEIEPHLEKLIFELLEDLERFQGEVKSCVVKIKYPDFKQTTIEQSAVEPNLEIFKRLFKERWQENPDPIRLLGVGVKFKDPESETPQLSFDSFTPLG
jgi:DNA polymerase IV